MTSYMYASVVQLVEDDPVNDREEGDIRLVPGKNEDGYSYTVMDGEKGEFVDVECRVLGRLEADYRMNRSEILSWASDQDEALNLAQEAGA